MCIPFVTVSCCYLLQAGNPVDILEQVACDDLLPAIKVCTDWLRGDVPTVRACGKESSELFRRLLELVNSINIDLKALEKGKLVQSECRLCISSLSFPLLF